jgi:hypothetical protein
VSNIVFFIEQTAIGLYILLAIGLFWYWRKWRHARYSYRATPFELERDVARYKIGAALTAMLLFVEAGLFVFAVQSQVAPTVRDDNELRDIVESFRYQPVNVPFATPTRPAIGTLPVDASGRDISGQQSNVTAAPPTVVSTPVGTIDPFAPPASGCDTPHAMLRIPANGMRVFEPIRVMGTAYVDNFVSYKLELNGPGTFDQFIILTEATDSVPNMGTLAEFDPAPWEPGLYKFRLVVFDASGTLQSHCEITITITIASDN